MRKKKFDMERITVKKAKITDKINALNMELDNADRETKKRLQKKQVVLLSVKTV